MSHTPLDAIRDTLHRILMDSGLLRPAPVPFQIMEVVNGRAYEIVPLGIMWPISCLYYASQDPRLERELLVMLHERKAVVDGGIHITLEEGSPLDLPKMLDRGWLRPMERPIAPESAWGEEYRVTARSASAS